MVSATRLYKSIIITFATIFCLVHDAIFYQSCDVNNDNRLDCHEEPGANSAACDARGCCWQPNYNNRSIPWCFYPKARQQCAMLTKARVDCHPDHDATPNDCTKRGCCWAPAYENDATPWCFYPSDYPSYILDAVNKTDKGFIAYLSYQQSSSTWPNPINKLKLSITFETETRLRMTFVDNDKSRWQVPIPLSQPQAKVEVSNFNVSFRKSPFGVTITRTSDNLVLFDTINVITPLIFTDQFLQITSALSVTKIYGLGEQRSAFLRNITAGFQRIGMWARDTPPFPNINLYGVHNFMLGLSDNGEAYGVYLLNSNAQEVVLQPTPAITYRTIGGILDFFIFSGPRPNDVVKQYWMLIGSPMLPAYWTLGFHLSRYGYGSLEKTNETLARNLAAKIPLDTMWNDIDYMDSYRDFTYDPKLYAGLPQFVDDLHNNGMHYVPIIDPAISSTIPGNYAPYDNGLKLQIYINKTDNSGPLIGVVWPGQTVYPDFTNPKAQDWWLDCFKDYYNKVKFDGVWIDMNEPSNFVDGAVTACPRNELEYPPYVPYILDSTLQAKTVCASSRQYLSTHYDLHSMYGYFESQATHYALTKLKPNKRPFILSRSTFSGSGQYTFHWTGDNQANWDNLYYSIPQILNFNLFAIPMVGADVCGFLLNTQEELCIRWMQLGSFYPFMRNHADKDSTEQDPAVWSEKAQDIMRTALLNRYSLLPYLYTQLYHAKVDNTMVIRPLYFEYPNDAETHAIDRQFMWGPSILVSPVLDQGISNIKAYIPDDIYYDYFAFTKIYTRKTWTNLYTPIDKINSFFRGGSIVPFQHPAMTTTLSRQLPFSLFTTLNNSGIASGDLFWDDGDSQDSISSGNYNFIQFLAANNEVTSQVVQKGFTEKPMYLQNIIIGNVQAKPTNVTFNGQSVPFSYNSTSSILFVIDMKSDLLQNFVLAWM